MTTTIGTDLNSAPRSDLDTHLEDFLTDPFPAVAALSAAVTAPDPRVHRDEPRTDEGESAVRALATHSRSPALTGQPQVRLINSLRTLLVHVDPA